MDRNGKLRSVFANESTFLIAELAQSHDGSLGFAHHFIDAAAQYGADAVKFQTHIAEAESTYDEPWRVKFSQVDDTRFDYWKRMEFTREQWIGLKKHAEDKDLIFLSSPFSVEAVELLDSIGIEAWKIASGELTNPELMCAVRKTNKPLIFSSGMSRESEIEKIISEILHITPCALLQCTTNYPCPPENWGLSLIPQFRKKYDIPIGFSDHSGDIFASLAAISLGATIIEIHVTFSKDMFGPDVPSSITFDQLRTISEGLSKIHQSLNSQYNKDAIADSLIGIKSIFGRSWALKAPMKQGETISRESLTLKKPGSGIGLDKLELILGRRLARDKDHLHLLQLSDFD